MFTVPSIKEEELALAIFLSMGEMSFKAITGRVGHSAETMGLTIFIQWTWKFMQKQCFSVMRMCF